MYHRFPCERGRWLGLDVNDRKCTLCNLHEVGDALHYVVICPFSKLKDRKYIDKYYYTSTNVLKFKELLNRENAIQLRNICIFAKMLIKRDQWSFSLKVDFMLFQNKLTLRLYYLYHDYVFLYFSSFLSYAMCMTWNKEYRIVLYCAVLYYCIVLCIVL